MTAQPNSRILPDLGHTGAKRSPALPVVSQREGPREALRNPTEKHQPATEGRPLIQKHICMRCQGPLNRMLFKQGAYLRNVRQTTNTNTETQLKDAPLFV